MKHSTQGRLQGLPFVSGGRGEAEGGRSSETQALETSLWHIPL